MKTLTLVFRSGAVVQIAVQSASVERNTLHGEGFNIRYQGSPDLLFLRTELVDAAILSDEADVEHTNAPLVLS